MKPFENTEAACLHLLLPGPSASKLPFLVQEVKDGPEDGHHHDAHNDSHDDDPIALLWFYAGRQKETESLFRNLGKSFPNSPWLSPKA